jgi:hypothetical protein
MIFSTSRKISGYRCICSNLGLARRLGFETVLLSKLINQPISRSVITWQDVAYLDEKSPLRLKSQRKSRKAPQRILPKSSATLTEMQVITVKYGVVLLQIH